MNGSSITNHAEHLDRGIALLESIDLPPVRSK